MRFVRLFVALLALSLLASLVVAGEPFALAQSTDETEEAVDEARERSETASGLVNEAVTNRNEVERELVESISHLNELTAQLSQVGADVDRIAAQVGYADVELAGIRADIEHQAIDAYMTVVASPGVSLVNSATVERALVAGSVVEDVVADGRMTVSQLLTKRSDLESLQERFLADQDEYQQLQEAVDAEVARYAALFEQADSQVAAAIRDAEAADRAFRSTLSAVEVARAKEAERDRQERRSSIEPTTTTTPTELSSPTTTTPPNSTTTEASSSTTTQATPSTTSAGGRGPWDHPPQVEQWRSLVQQFFPSNRVEEALRIIDCESNGDAEAVNPYSGAAGLFQFLPSTWASTSPQAGYGGSSALDPEANIATAAWLAGHYQSLGYDYWHAWNCKRTLD
jgi:septal ring factor EnvC (AmiA/AmiB activator)